jgi:hypothetical protein
MVLGREGSEGEIRRAGLYHLRAAEARTSSPLAVVGLFGHNAKFTSRFPTGIQDHLR